MDETLVDGVRRGDRRALSRLLTLLARGEGEVILARLPPPTKPSRVVAITGSGGVGKSTLVGKLIEPIREQGLTVAVLACDPQSPVSGGALLGDRFRMPSRPDDTGVFIRSLAAISGQGAVATHLDRMIRLLEVFGFEVIVIETVGAGQGDTAVREWADVMVLLLQPETGDDLQWEKAGVLEVADIVVIHKADLPSADRVESQVRAALSMNTDRSVPVIRVSSRTGEGLSALWDAIAPFPPQRDRIPPGRDLLRHCQETLAERFDAALVCHDKDLAKLLAEWQHGNLDRDAAVAAVLNLLITTPPSTSAS